MKTVVITHSVDKEGSYWGISLSCSNPSSNEWFKVSSPEEAARIKNMLETWVNNA